MTVDLESKAAEALEQWVKPDLPPQIAGSAQLDPAIPIALGREFSHWMVNVRSRGRIVGSMDFGNDCSLQRYETRIQRLEDLKALGPATAELPPIKVKELAAAGSGEKVALQSEPVLTAHGSPTRIVWQVSAMDKSGNLVNVFVTPKHVWAEPR